MKKNKGFTLIELLAVILILGIIALIAIPTVNNIINESKIGAFKSTYNGITKAAEQQCMSDKIKGKALKNTYSFVDGKSIDDLNIKGKIPEVGFVQVNDDCLVTSAYIRDDNLAVKKNISDETIIGKIEDGKIRYESSKDEYKISSDTVGLSGSGTEADPYQISSIEDLVYLSKNATSYINSYMILTTSLDFNNPDSYINSERTDMNFDSSTDSLLKNLTTGAGFKPITSERNTDDFHFDGKGHKIKKLY